MTNEAFTVVARLKNLEPDTYFLESRAVHLVTPVSERTRGASAAAARCTRRRGMRGIGQRRSCSRQGRKTARCVGTLAFARPRKRRSGCGSGAGHKNESEDEERAQRERAREKAAKRQKKSKKDEKKKQQQRRLPATPLPAPQAPPRRQLESESESEEEEEKEEEDKHAHAGVKCSLCQDRCATFVVRPCGHRMSCVTCEPMVARMVEAKALLCPICRENVEGTLQVPGAKFIALGAQSKVCRRAGCANELNKRRYLVCDGDCGAQFSPFCVGCLSGPMKRGGFCGTCRNTEQHTDIYV